MTAVITKKSEMNEMRSKHVQQCLNSLRVGTVVFATKAYAKVCKGPRTVIELKDDYIFLRSESGRMTFTRPKQMSYRYNWLGKPDEPLPTTSGKQFTASDGGLVPIWKAIKEILARLDSLEKGF
jgi:hypothetical protein